MIKRMMEGGGGGERKTKWKGYGREELEMIRKKEQTKGKEDKL